MGLEKSALTRLYTHKKTPTWKSIAPRSCLPQLLLLLLQLPLLRNQPLKRTPAAKKSAPRARQAATAISRKLNCENMIIETVVNNPSRTGHSVRKLLEIVKQENKYNNDLALKRALKKLLAENRLVSVKGSGLSGSVKISPEESARRKAAVRKTAAAKKAKIAAKKKSADAKKKAAKKKAQAAKKKKMAANKKAAAAKKKASRRKAAPKKKAGSKKKTAAK